MYRRQLRSRLYVLTPTSLAGTRALDAFVEAMVGAGVGLVQYRAKNVDTRTMVEDCQRLLRITRPAGVPLIVNDRVDVALAVGADGVHVGARDMPVAYARRLMGPIAIVGATAPTPRLAREAQQGGASYVAVGPMFATPNAPEKPPIGPEGIAPVRAVTPLPVCAIGGITEDNIEQVAAAKPDLIAVMGAVADADAPAVSARRLAQRISELLGQGGPEL
ncbi:MAG: thiamine phosphate synthase [Armatimonadetes bacterium]|nr:thiamine phosphate synthase [Armatimonadota bacterium]